MNSIIGKYRLNGKKEKYKIALILSFVLPVVIMMSIFVIKGIYPFGDRSFLFSDMYHQYMPFFSEFLRKVKAGEGLSYSYYVGIGTNFLALYVYYLASPLHYLAFLVPETHLMEFMSYLVVVKIGLSGLTFFLYLRYHFQCRDGNILFFSCFYALSGFMAAYNWNIMWIDCVVLLPLIILGLERLVTEGRCGMYCITLALSIFTNYYISIMICIFLVLYFAVLLLTEKRSLRIVGNFVFYSLLAGGMAGILLVPEVCAILQTNFGEPDFPDKLQSYFSVLDMLARHCMCVTTERGLEHWPNIYCGAAVFLLLPIYVLNQKIPIRRRFANMALAGFLLFSFATNVLDFLWHGMNYPDSLPARQSFLYIFLMLTMCFEAYRNMEEIDRRQILYGYLAAAVFLLGCEKFVESDDFDIGIEILTLAFVTVYAVILYLYRTQNSYRRKIVLSLVTLVIVIAESSVNTFNTSVGTTDRTAYLESQENYKALYQWARGQSDGFWRMEKFTRKTKNDGTLAGYPTASVFSSTMNSYVMELYERWGMRHSKVYYGFDGATAFTSALLNVEYMFGESDKYATSVYEQMIQSGDIFLYHVNSRLPFGYVAPTGYDLQEGYRYDGIGLQNAMIKDLGIQGKLFTRVTSRISERDLVFTAGERGIYYAQLSASGIKKMEIVGGPLEIRELSDLKKGSILYLGYLEEGDSLTLEDISSEDEQRKVTAEIYRMDEGVLEKALELLSEQHLEEVTYDSTHLTGRITMREAGRLILSVPYEKGWHITVNEEETEPTLFGGTFIAFDLEPGEYAISMDYTPEGRNAGILLSVVSLGVFVLLIGGKRKKTPASGEGAESPQRGECRPACI